MSQTPEQRRETWLSETIAGLWARWHESGADNVSRGWDRPFEGTHGPYTVRIILTRADVGDLVDYIGIEHGKDQSKR